MVRRALAALVLAVLATFAATAANPGAAAATDTAATDTAATDTSTTTTLPLDQGDRSVIPAPNSGREPEDAGDRGGWAQLGLFALMAVACAAIFGRVLWAGHQRSRANKLN